jgi:hypothetical protein
VTIRRFSIRPWPWSSRVSSSLALSRCGPATAGEVQLPSASAASSAISPAREDRAIARGDVEARRRNASSHGASRSGSRSRSWPSLALRRPAGRLLRALLRPRSPPSAMIEPQAVLVAVRLTRAREEPGGDIRVDCLLAHGRDREPVVEFPARGRARGPCASLSRERAPEVQRRPDGQVRQLQVQHAIPASGLMYRTAGRLKSSRIVTVLSRQGSGASCSHGFIRDR